MITNDVAAHYRALWGEPSRKAEFTAFGHRVEVYKWSEDANPEGVNLYATIGCSVYPIVGFNSEHRLELYAGLLPAADDVAKPLAMVALDPILHNTPLSEGHTITYPEPLWRGTAMNSVLIMRPVEPIIPPLRTAGVHVDFLQVVPIFASELAVIRRAGHRGLLAHWQRKRVPLWDPRRSAEPPANAG